MSERKKVLLRLDPALHDALAGWGADELRSTNAQIEFLLRRAAADAGRLPGPAPPAPSRAAGALARWPLTCARLFHPARSVIRPVRRLSWRRRKGHGRR